MEGFGQHTTFHLKLTKQTWAVFHQRREQGGWEGMVMGYLVGRGHLPHPTGQGLGWCCRSWPRPWWGLTRREGFGARSKGKGPALLWSNREGFDCCREGFDWWSQYLPWLFTILLPFYPLLSPHMCFHPGGFPTVWPLVSCSPTANRGGSSRN